MYKVLLTTGSCITLGFGIWHFFVPKVYQWFSYIPDIPEELKEAILATNFFFSFSLASLGLLTILLSFIPEENITGLRIVSIIMSCLWIVRTIYQIIQPQGTMIQGLSIIILVSFLLTALFFIGATIVLYI